MGPEWQPWVSHFHPLLTQQLQKNPIFLPIVFFIRAECSMYFSRRLTQLKFFWEHGEETIPTIPCRHFLPLMHPWVRLLVPQVLAGGGCWYPANILQNVFSDSHRHKTIDSTFSGSKACYTVFPINALCAVKPCLLAQQLRLGLPYYGLQNNQFLLFGLYSPGTTTRTLHLDFTHV